MNTRFRGADSDELAPPQRRNPFFWAVALAAAVSLTACSDSDVTSDPPTPSRLKDDGGTDSPSSSAADRPESTYEPSDIDFVFQLPEEPCPAAGPRLGGGRLDMANYRLLDPRVHEQDENIHVICLYDREELLDDNGSLVSEDHVRIVSELSLYPTREDSPSSANYAELPATSRELIHWEEAVLTSRELDAANICDIMDPCGKESSVALEGREHVFAGHVGNLEFYVSVIYFSETIPEDALERNTAIFRNLALATVENYEPAD